MLNRIFIIAIIASLLFLSHLTAQSAEQVGFVKLPANATDWVVDKTSERVFCAVENSDEIIEFGSNGEKVRTFEVGDAVAELIIKGDKLVAACTKESALYICDLKTNKFDKKISMTGFGPRALFCSSVKNNFIYAATSPDSQLNDTSLYQVDIANSSVKEIENKAFAYDNIMHGVMSPDGTMFFYDERNRSSPSGGNTCRVDEEKLTFERVYDEHETYGVAVAGSNNKFLVLGRILIPDFNLKKPVKNFANQHVALHPTYNLAATYSAPAIHFENVLGERVKYESIQLEGVEVPKKTRRGRRRERDYFDPQIKFIGKSKLFVGLKQSGHWLDCSSEMKKSSLFHLVTMPAQHSAQLGQELKIPLKVTNFESNSALKLRVVGEEKTVKLEGKTLTYRPSTKDTGVKKIKVELLENDNVIDSTETSILTTLPKIDFGFTANLIQLSPSKKTALVWSSNDPRASLSARDKMPENEFPCAVLNLENKTVIAKSVMKTKIFKALVTDSNIFYINQTGNYLYRTDLELKNNTRRVVSVQPGAIELGENNVLILKPNRYGSSRLTTYLDPVSLKPIKGESFAKKETSATPTLPSISEYAKEPQSRSRFSMSNAKKIIWNRRILYNGIETLDGKRINNWNSISGNKFYPSEQWPMVAFPKIELKSLPGQRVKTARIELRDLVDGEIKESVAINSEIGNDRMRVDHFEPEMIRVFDAENELGILNKNAIYFLKPNSDLFPIPTQFAKEQLKELQVGKVERVPLKILGAKQEANFSLERELPGVTINSTNGELQIDTAEIWNRFVETTNLRAFGYHYTPNEDGGKTRRPTIHEIYQAITSQELPKDKLAAELRISVVMKLDGGIRERAKFPIRLVGPRTVIDERVAKQKVEHAKMVARNIAAQKEFDKKRAEQLAKMNKEKERNQQKIAAENQLIDDLEAHVDRIQTKLDSILDKLEKIKR